MSEYQANLALIERADQVKVGRHFATPGVVHSYRKPSLWARIVAFFN